MPLLLLLLLSLLYAVCPTPDTSEVPVTDTMFGDTSVGTAMLGSRSVRVCWRVVGVRELDRVCVLDGLHGTHMRTGSVHGTS
jgi:hypothetical protein